MSDTLSISVPRIRPAAILIENDSICLVKQEVSATRHWSLPGGKLEKGESIADGISREFREETGLEVRLKELLYVTDRIPPAPEIHILHITFLVERTENGELPSEWTHLDPFPSASSDALRVINMAPLDKLEEWGFTPVFCDLARNGFPGKGSYQGDFFTFYGETPDSTS